MFRLEDVFRPGRYLLRGGYPTLVTAVACALVVLLLWPQSPRIYTAESIAAASAPGETLVAANDVIAWLKSDEVLRTAIANLRSSQAKGLSAILTPSATDPITALRERLHLVRLDSPDEMPRLAIGCDAPGRRAALAVASELARQLAEHHAAQMRRDRLAQFASREQQVAGELKDARSAEERLQVELQGLRHAQLTSAVTAAAPTTPAVTPAAAAADRRATDLVRTLESLKLERDRLAEIYLPAHPQIQSLSAQISRLEEACQRASPEPELEDGGKTLLQWRRDDKSEESPASDRTPVNEPAHQQGQVTAALQQSQLDLLTATHRRQQAEQDWQAIETERKQIESASDVTWQVQPALITSTSGGPLARQQLAAAAIAAALGGLGVAWFASRDQRMTTAADVRASVGLPLLATLSSGDNDAVPAELPAKGQALVQLATRCSEAVLVTFVLTLVAAVLLDRGLLADLRHDPLATLGELVQRLI